MTDEEIKKLVESAVAAAVTAVTAPVASLTERALKGDAMIEARKILTPLALQEASKARVIDLVLSQPLPLKEGALDLVKFTEAVNEQAKAEGAYVAGLTEAGRVRGMGATPPADPATETKVREAGVRTHKKALDVFSEFGISEAAAKAIASEYGEAA